MKLIRFNLRAFGQFKNFPIEFDPKKSLHVIYGENESGKTTFTRAYMALLFGIEKKTSDAYLSSLDHLFLEGLFETEAGKYQQVIREHKLSKKLNLELKSLFPNLTKTQYGENFILNDQTLLSGSKDLITYLKNFDLNLFHNATGLHQIKGVIKKLELSGEGLFKPKGTKPLINQNYLSFTDLYETRKGMQLSDQDYEKIISSLVSLEAEKKENQEKIEALLFKEKLLALPCTLCDALQELEQVQQKIKELDDQLDSDDHYSTIDPKDWSLVKEELQKFLKVYLIETSHLVFSKEEAKRFEKKIRDIKNQLDQTAQVKNLNPLKEQMASLKAHRGLEEEEKQKRETIVQAQRKIEEKLALLNFKFSSFCECLAIVLPSRSDLDKLSESHYSISHYEKELDSKRLELKKQNEEIEKELLKVARQASFNLESYHVNRKERSFTGELILENWSSNSSGESLRLFQLYQDLVSKESGFTDSVLKDSDAFVLYKQLDHLKKKSEIDLKNLNEREQKLVLQKEQMAEALSLYRKKWGLDSLTYSQLKDICAEVPFVQNEVQALLSSSEELESMGSEVLRIKTLLKESFTTESFKEGTLRELFDHLQKKIHQMTQATQIREELIKQLSESERHLQLNHQSTLTRMNSFEKISTEWVGFLARTKLSLNLDEPSIRQFLLKFEHFIQRSIQKNHLKKEVLDEKTENVNQLYIQIAEMDWEEWSQEPWTQLLSPCFMDKDCRSQLLVDLKNFRIDLESIGSKTKQERVLLRETLSKIDQKLGQVQFQKSSMNQKSSQKEIEALLQDHLFHLESHIETYLTAKLSQHLLKKMVRGYQDQYQEPLLEKVSQNFSDLTSGRYERVKLNILDQDSYLTCSSKQGEAPVNQLSHGTRDQLFLSLKLALIEQMQEGQEPMPLLLDDILVQFDEPRALKALELLKKLSKKSQIIFLTHHRHILELVEKGMLKEDYQVHSLRESKEKALQSL